MAIVTSDIIATTLPKYSATIEKNLPRLSPVLTQVAKKGRSRKGGWSGSHYRQVIEYNLNSNVMFFANSEAWRTDRQNILTHADFYLRQLVGTVTVEGVEETMNSGEEAVHNFVATKIQNLERSLQQIVAESWYYDGTEFDGKAFSGAPAFYVPNNSIGVVGGIDRATAVDIRGRKWWQNQVVSIGQNAALAPPPIAAGGPEVRPMTRAMVRLNIKVKNNADTPDLFAAPDDHYVAYLEEVMEKQMITTTAKERAGYGFSGLVFGFAPSVDIVNDSVAPSAAQGGVSYLLNTDYISHCKARRWMDNLPKVRAINQDVTAQSVISEGNFTVSNMEREGVLIN